MVARHAVSRDVVAMDELAGLKRWPEEQYVRATMTAVTTPARHM